MLSIVTDHPGQLDGQQTHGRRLLDEKTPVTVTVMMKKPKPPDAE